MYNPPAHTQLKWWNGGQLGRQSVGCWLGHTSRMGLPPVFGSCLPRKQKRGGLVIGHVFGSPSKATNAWVFHVIQLQLYFGWHASIQFEMSIVNRIVIQNNSEHLEFNIPVYPCITVFMSIFNNHNTLINGSQWNMHWPFRNWSFQWYGLCVCSGTKYRSVFESSIQTTKSDKGLDYKYLLSALIL